LEAAELPIGATCFSILSKHFAQIDSELVLQVVFIYTIFVWLMFYYYLFIKFQLDSKVKYYVLIEFYFHSTGGCKHLVAFLFWIHRRCEEPSPTEVACYWKRSSLSTVGEKKCMSLKEFCGDKYPTCEGPSQTNELYNAFRDKCLEKGIENMITSMNPNDNPSMSLHILKIDFLKINSVQSDANKFIKFCSDSMTVELCQEIEKLTRGQSLSKLWFNLRYGRITASKAYDAAHCNTEDGSLVNQILGAKLFLTEPMKRGMRLEEEVLREIGIQLNCAPKKCGLFLSPKFPLFGATPDGIGNGFLIEVKCPSSQKAMASYIFTDGSIKPKYYTQVQLQMLLCGFNKCVFVVAHPDFETSRNITKIWATLDNCYVSQIVNKCTQFWEKYIYKFI